MKASDSNSPSTVPLSIIINPYDYSEAAQSAALALSHKYSLPLTDDLSEPSYMQLGWYTVKKDPIQKLALFQNESGPVFIDFISGKKAHRRHFGGGKGQPLVRAMGKLKEGLPTILDATAGMGGDSFVLASQGHQVQMIERSVAVAALLADGLARAGAALTSNDGDSKDDNHEKNNNDDNKERQALLSIINSLSIKQANSADYLLSEQPKVDVIYMDPMYPEKKKNAATKKEMKALQNLVGPDRDSEKLLSAALQTASYRVVVKRPKGAPIIELDNPKLIPSANISSPNTRYDIYSIKALKSAGLI
ncbi:MAG: 16S rRNA (guanine1516-N2)-methyltransferase [Thiomicrorhabdus sp.]|nr:MAG: 16S rRNA (guanine1516-N2)-methyltransferase [Thiomicrorhabdus sp.]